jgi:hypothetical protein
MSLNSANVVVAVTGAVYVANIGAPAPTNATSALDPVWKNLGYISVDGVTESHTVSSDALAAWQNNRVRTIISKYQVDYSFECLETKQAVLERFYDFAPEAALVGAGAPAARTTRGPYPETYTANYTGGSGTEGFPDHTIRGIRSDQYMALVIDVVDHTATIIRRYIPKAVLTERGEVKMTQTDALAYPFRLEALPDQGLGGSVRAMYSRVL